MAHTHAGCLPLAHDDILAVDTESALHFASELAFQEHWKGGHLLGCDRMLLQPRKAIDGSLQRFKWTEYGASRDKRTVDADC